MVLYNEGQLCEAESLNLTSMTSNPAASFDVQLEIPGIGSCSLTHEPLNVDEIIRMVSDDGAGATGVFIGTTRNSFKGIVGSCSISRVLLIQSFKAKL